MDQINRTMNTIRISNSDDDDIDYDNELKRIKYPARDGQELEFDVSKETCQIFGFHFGDLVSTPNGPARVIGVRNGHLWFHLTERDKGATYWDNGKDHKSLINDLGIKLESKQYQEVDCQLKEFKVNEGKTILIVLNEKKEFSMLVSIANLLLLQERIKFESGKTRVTLSDLASMVIKYTDSSNREKSKEIAQYREEELPTLIHTGVHDVNVKYNGINGFDPKTIYNIFTFLNIKLYHGWLYPESEDGYDMITDLTHHDLEARMTNITQSFPNMSIQFESTVKDFLSGEQMTYDGWEKIKAALQANEMCIFYRNNQFSTMRKINDNLQTLEVGRNHTKTSWNTVEI